MTRYWKCLSQFNVRTFVFLWLLLVNIVVMEGPGSRCIWCIKHSGNSMSLLSMQSAGLADQSVRMFNL